MTHGTKRARRGKGEGSLYQRGDGFWVAQVDAGYYPNGRRKYARAVRARKADALSALDTLRRQVAEGLVPDQTSTLGSFLDFWLTDVEAGNVSDGTLAEYRKRVRRVPPEVAKIRLHKLGTPHLQRMANQLSETKSPKTVSDTLGTIKQALRWAVHARMIGWNPAEGVRLRAKPGAKLDDTLTADEARAVIAAAEGTDMHALAFLALTYGMRLGELLDLRWSAVDLRAGTLTVAQAKTRAGERTLPLLDEPTAVLRAHRQATPMRGADGYVFPTADGRRRSPQRTREAWSALLTAAGVEHRCRTCGTDKACSSAVRRFHSSRHTAATLLLERGVPMEVVSAILGHAGISITADTYARVRQDAMRRGLAALDA